MTTAHYVALLSAFLGAAGTIVLFFGTYGLQPFEGAAFGGPIVNEANAHIAAMNEARMVKQRVGLALLCTSFFAQAVAVLLA